MSIPSWPIRSIVEELLGPDAWFAQSLEREYETETPKIAATRIKEMSELIAGFHRKLETFVSVYPGDKELVRLLSECRAILAKNGEL